MSQPTRQPKRRAHSTKKARTKSTSQPQALLDPPQIRKFIRRYFRAQPERGDALWSLILGDDDLLKAWKVYAKAGKEKEFWEWSWPHIVRLEHDEGWALYEMRRNPHHLIRLCRDQAILLMACDVFAASGSLPEDKAAQISYCRDALVSRASERMGELMDAGHPAAELWPPESWWMHQVWDDAAVKFARNRDPIRVAQWVADANPVAAEQCLKENGHELTEIDTAVIDLGNKAVTRLSALVQAEVSFEGSREWPNDPIPGLVSLIAGSVHRGTITLQRVIDECIAEVFYPAIYDWESIIGVGFRGQLLSTIDNLQRYASQVRSLKPEQRTKRLILHIDDEIGVRTLISIMFARAFGEQLVTVSADGCASALILASTLLPDLVLTDVMEPWISGFVFAALLKMNPVTQKVPFIFLTARGDPESVKIAMELGAADYLTKPILHKDLTALIENVMGLEAQPSK